MKRLTTLSLTFILIFIGTIAGACGVRNSETILLPTAAQLPTILPTLTRTIGPRYTLTPSQSPTATFTATPFLTATDTATITVSPSLTITDTITPTPSNTPTITPTQRELNSLEVLGMLAAQATVLPSDFTIGGTPIATRAVLPIGGSGGIVPSPTITFPGIECPNPAPGGFGSLIANNATISALIGCSISNPAAPQTVSSAYQPFESGFMVWIQFNGGQIYAVFNSGTYRVGPDAFVDGVDPQSGGETPPNGLIEPIRGFGKIWRENADIRSGLGWGMTGESGAPATILQFNSGVMLSLPQRSEIIVFFGDGTWRGYSGSF